MKRFLFLAAVMSSPMLAATGGFTLPWETPIQAVSASISGPVAGAIGLVGIVGCGYNMSKQHHDTHGTMLNSIGMLLGTAVVVKASGILGLFGITGALIG